MKNIFKKTALASVCAIATASAYAQFTPGHVLNGAQSNSAISGVLPLTGGTLQGPLSFANTAAATATTTQLQYLQGATGSAPRSLTGKFQDVVSIMDFPGCDKTGSNDSTACIQTALNSGSLGVYVPTGRFEYSSLTMPPTLGFSLFGDGTSSILIQTGTGLKWPTLATGNTTVLQTVRDIQFLGGSGSGNTVDSSFAQGLDFLDLTFVNTPVGFSSLKLEGNPIDGTYMHDVRAKNIRIYSTTAGNAGIELGPHASDSTIDGFIMNGNFVVSYGLLADVNAQAIIVSNSHPYNTRLNVVYLAGNNGYFTWSNNTFDNSLSNVFYQKNSNNGIFTNTFFEAINPAASGMVFDNSHNNALTNTTCATARITNATACLAEVNGSAGNRAINTQVDALTNYLSPFKFTGSGSYVNGAPGYSIYNSIYSLVGTATTPQAQNTTTDLGVNGAGAASATAFPVPLQGALLSATVSVDTPPATGQTYTFNLMFNGIQIGTGTIAARQYQVTIIPTTHPYPVSLGAQVWIQSIFSATSGSATPRYSITFQG